MGACLKYSIFEFSIVWYGYNPYNLLGKTTFISIKTNPYSNNNHIT